MYSGIEHASPHFPDYRVRAMSRLKVFLRPKSAGRAILLIFVGVFLTSCSGTRVMPPGNVNTAQATRIAAGTVSLVFVPIASAQGPQPPVKVALLLKAASSGAEQVYRLTGAPLEWFESRRTVTLQQNFSLALAPGTYQITGLELSSDSLDAQAFEVPVPAATMTVAEETECSYVGQMLASFIRLPAGTPEQAQKDEKLMEQHMNRQLGVVYLAKGALIVMGFSIAPPQSGRAADGAGYAFYQQAVAQGCEEHLIKARHQE